MSLHEQLKADIGIQPSDNLSSLRKQIAVKNTQAFHALLNIMNGTHKRTKDEQVEATYILFLYAYQYGNMDVGKKAMEILFTEVSSPIYQKYFSDLLLNVAFYALPIGVQTKHNLKQRLFRDLNNLNPFIFRDQVTNDYISGSRIMNLSRNRGSEYEIYVYSNEGFLIHNFALKYKFDYKKFNRLGATTGAEDIRVICIPQETDIFLAVGTTMDTHAEGMIKMSLFYLHVDRDSNKHISNITAKDLIPLKGYEDNKRQKNWLPFYHDNQLFFTCKYDPLTVLSMKENGTMELISVEKNKLIEKLARARGSVPPIPYNGNWLFIVHYSETKHKKYYHRFVEMKLSASIENEAHMNEDLDQDETIVQNDTFIVHRISRIFYFEKSHTIEFAINMIPHTENGEDGVLISYGVADKVCRISFLSFYDIERSFIF